MQGRCAGEGCGFEGSYKQALSHVQRCPAFAELYVNDSARALDPAVEFRRVAAERKPEAPARARSTVRQDSPEAPARVAPPRSRARPVPAPAGVVEPVRERRPVVVEQWIVPDKLVQEHH